MTSLEVITTILTWYLNIGLWMLGIATFVIFVRQNIMPWNALSMGIILLFHPKKLIQVAFTAFMLVLTWPSLFSLIFSAKNQSEGDDI